MARNDVRNLPASEPSSLYDKAMNAGPVLQSRCTKALRDRQTNFGLTQSLEAAQTRVGEMEPAICWQALRSRDRRFDGRFYVAAVTTGIYCRPTCPVPFAKPNNISLFACAAAAEAAGFRPCTRCRPQASPGTPAWLGTSAVVSRALRLIWQGGLDDKNVEELAARVGIGSRQLRRLFVQHLGASPVKIASTHRLHFARNLIDETDLAITLIALVAGFKSIRQFNHAVKERFGQSPTELRKQRGETPSTSGGLTIRLPYRPPFEWESIAKFFQTTATPGVEFVQSGLYRRTVRLDNTEGFIEVRNDAGESRLMVRIELSNYDCLMPIVERIRRILDLEADPVQISTHLSRNPTLAPLVQKRPGLRVPGVWDGFELVVKMLVDSHSTRGQSNFPMGQLVQAFGKPLKHQVEGLTHLFPTPEALADAGLESLGLSSSLAQLIRRLSRRVAAKELRFDSSNSLEETISRAGRFCEMDDCMAQYIAMRAFGEPDAFPVGDPHLKQLAETCRPWRAYAAMHLTWPDNHFVFSPS